jgi:formate dehydrogenase iron-sulfur subunit
MSALPILTSSDRPAVRQAMPARPGQAPARTGQLPERPGATPMSGGRYGQPEPMGFFTDTTICIGCKACEVACKNWNQLPSVVGELSGQSYDNTLRLDGENWRHVRFVEQFDEDYNGRWLMMSDVCKHCVQAGCLEVCPTNAIIRTEFDTVVIQSDACNGCRMCISACPFGVIDINPVSQTAQKCTLCYDRMTAGLEPACSQACPTDSIQFGTVEELRERAHRRVQDLHANGQTDAYLYGADPAGPLGGLNAFFLLVDAPEVYGLPREPKLPSLHLLKGMLASGVTAVVLAVAAVLGFRKNRMDGQARGEARPAGPGPGPEPPTLPPPSAVPPTSPPPPAGPPPEEPEP